ncbi:MAG TPA: hypothetical protein VJ252_03835 [Chthoniobacterales bacterium]|nr:hypothetical protein [Chthoniobacterales bacterium]
MKATARCVTVAIAICSWIALSNHCAVAAVAAQTETARDECPFHSKPAKQPGNSLNLLCCKILRAVFPAVAKDWARDDASFSEVDLGVGLRIVLTESHNAAPLLRDTGPPGKTSFVELIGSVHAHAPPSRV